MQMTITEKNFKELNKLYKKAVADSKEQFIWEGQDILTAYAKYLIQYIEMKVGKK